MQHAARAAPPRPPAPCQFILEDLCLVCVSSYVVNGLIFVFAVRRYLAKKAKSKAKSS